MNRLFTVPGCPGIYHAIQGQQVNEVIRLDCQNCQCYEGNKVLTRNGDAVQAEFSERYPTHQDILIVINRSHKTFRFPQDQIPKKAM